jgi:hypothetical protein
MKLRFENVSPECQTLVNDVRKKYFPELAQANIKVLFDLKKTSRMKRLVLGRIMSPNEFIRYLTIPEIDEGYDYVMILDKVGWEVLPREDIVRIVRHELRHTYYDIEKEDRKQCYKIVDHDFQDFFEEVELNTDDPNWCSRAATLIEDVYDQRKEDAKEKAEDGTPKRGRGRPRKV